MLTKEQIEEIVSYERYCLDTSTFTGVEPVCDTEQRAARAADHDHRGRKVMNDDRTSSP